MNLDRAYRIHGWMYDVELRWLAEQASKRQRIAEVGCWQGRSTRAMADNLPHSGKLWAIDTWQGTPGEHDRLTQDKPIDWLYATFLANLQDLIDCSVVTPWRCASVFAATKAKQLQMQFDMVFIDAAHDYASVKADLQAWQPLLAPDGLLCGHDYEGGRAGVVRAVQELLPHARRVGVGSLWSCAVV